MPVDNNNNQVLISRTKSRFPEYLDFSTMRTAAISYLGPITSKYWTDYNVHDPGITILEALIYALIDLGYRANFSIDDILARNPNDKSKDNLFNSPAQLLGSNPLTIIDYRKKLMDIEEVRNAWLEIDQTEILSDQINQRTWLNGLFQVYIELEQDLIDFKTEKEWESYKKKVFHKVRQELTQHRNLCEDFTQIHFLCKMPLGICLDIELRPGQDSGQIYQNIITALHNFFSPAPSYYTLGQLIEKNISLDTIFAGRPYNGFPSYGFILDEDLPDRRTGETAIHISDIYKLILNIEGVSAIRKLQLENCDDKDLKQPDKTKDWEFFLPDGFLPELSLACSSVRFYKNGQLLTIDLSAYNAILLMKLAHQGKVLYSAGAPSLDAAIPNGNLKDGLGEYYSIQNDFPQVYGIGPGGLPPDASPLRKSQAFQLKGYLLFFDQLLADYLAQLAHIRDLFSVSPDSGQGISQTYFAGNLSSLPGLAPLLRFPAGTDGAGKTLVFPVDKKKWDAVTKANLLSCKDREQLQAYTFESAIERDNAIDELILGFMESVLTVNYLETGTSDPDKNQYVYFISSTWNGFVLVSRNIFPDEGSASSEASTVFFIGAAKENYSLISLSGSSLYGFNLIQTALSYYGYLQRIIEDPNEYVTRRTGFLNHLMSRFSESFTDYAMLSAGFLSQPKIDAGQVGLVNQFLYNFPVLSAECGKAADYLRYGWNNDNISGLEKRFKAYCGIEKAKRHFLCHFEVHKFEELYNIEWKLAGEPLFTCLSPLQKNEALSAAESLFNSMSVRENLRPVSSVDQEDYIIDILFYEQYHARSVTSWSEKREAEAAADMMSTMFRRYPVKGDLWVSEFEFRLELRNHGPTFQVESREGFSNKKNALAGAKKLLTQINKSEFWKLKSGSTEPIGKLYHNKDQVHSDEYLDSGRFKIYIQNDIIGEPDRCRFEVLDRQNTFQFRSLRNFGSEEEAKLACYELLFLLSDTKHYRERQDDLSGLYRIWITVDGEDLANTEKEFETADSATNMIKAASWSVLHNMYWLSVKKVPIRWKFNFILGLPGMGQFLFHSEDAYETEERAFQEAGAFHRAGPAWTVSKAKQDILLGNDDSPVCHLEKSSIQKEVPDGELKEDINRLLKAKEEIYRLSTGDVERFQSLVQLSEPSKKGTHMYRLIDKDHPKAYHPVSFQEGKKQDAEKIRENLIIKHRSGYLYLQICLGGDNVYQGMNSAKENGLFYYQIKCRNDYFSRKGVHVKGHELVLFESVEGFGTSDAAQLAFQSNYLTILHYAMDTSNYGDKKYISLRDRADLPKHEMDKSTVFVPAESINAFAYASLDPVNELKLASLTYPIRYTHNEKKFYFILYNDETHQLDWRSDGDFLNIDDTTLTFDFFLVLLNYHGNYFINFDEQECSFRVGIREVLMESRHPFKDAEEAWGPGGVERFICIAQSQDGFHMNLRPDCFYSYFIACKNHEAIHPCKYDTAEKRDEVRNKMYQAAKNFPVEGWLSGFGLGEKKAKKKRDTAILYDPFGSKIIRIPVTDGFTKEEALDLVLDIIDAVWTGNHIHKDHDGLYLLAGDKQVKFRPAGHPETTEKWQEKLLEFAAYFPISRKVNEQGGIVAGDYVMELKLPGFADLPGSDLTGMDCGCLPVKPETFSNCYAAWVSKIIYKTAEEAWKAYEKLIPLLKTLNNYRAVFDSSCDGYGLELHEENSIVAANPQYYFYPEMACDAVARTKASINTEGLDIVEHILLRKDREDAKHSGKIPVCSVKNECSDVWSSSLTMGSGTDMPLYFKAGGDPYSFIISVALPAWPARFRKKENRIKLESILQREAPAHILLRILWLTPKDMCRFEGYYKSWLSLLSLKTEGAGFTPSEFIGFLFSTVFDCLNECMDCQDLPQPGMVTGGPCTEDPEHMDITQSNRDWLSQINLLYCWKDMLCNDTSQWGLTGKVEKELKEIQAENVIPEMEQFVERVEQSSLTEKQKTQLINSRLRGYRKQVEEMAVLMNEEELLDKTEKYLLKPKPLLDQFEKILSELVSFSKKAKGKRKAQVNILIEQVIGYYLDKVSFVESLESEADRIREILDNQGFRISDPEGFYKRWNLDEFQQIVPEQNIYLIKLIIEGNNQ